MISVVTGHTETRFTGRTLPRRLPTDRMYMRIVAVLTCGGVDTAVLPKFGSFFQVRTFTDVRLTHRGTLLLIWCVWGGVGVLVLGVNQSYRHE